MQPHLLQLLPASKHGAADGMGGDVEMEDAEALAGEGDAGGQGQWLGDVFFSDAADGVKLSDVKKALADAGGLSDMCLGGLSQRCRHSLSLIATCADNHTRSQITNSLICSSCEVLNDCCLCLKVSRLQAHPLLTTVCCTQS